MHKGDPNGGVFDFKGRGNTQRSAYDTISNAILILVFSSIDLNDYTFEISQADSIIFTDTTTRHAIKIVQHVNKYKTFGT